MMHRLWNAGLLGAHVENLLMLTIILARNVRRTYDLKELLLVDGLGQITPQKNSSLGEIRMK